MVSVALVGDGATLVADGDNERALLLELDATLAGLAPGVIITWNGAGFDLPFIHSRAALHGIPLGLRLWPDPAIGGRHEPLPGHPGPYRARWYRHRHLDGYQLYRADVGATVGLSCALKSLARFVGLPVIEVDRGRIHELTTRERRDYVASDAHLARSLVARRAGAAAAIDQWPASRGS